MPPADDDDIIVIGQLPDTPFDGQSILCKRLLQQVVEAGWVCGTISGHAPLFKPVKAAGPYCRSSGYNEVSIDNSSLPCDKRDADSEGPLEPGPLT